jgi:hypothetical protein
VSKCEAVQYSDEMSCMRCDLRWDTNEPVPPKCKPRHSLDGVFESAAEALAHRSPNTPAGEIAMVSIAISLKRIADGFDQPCNAWGETAVEAIGGNIGRALSEDRTFRQARGL